MPDPPIPDLFSKIKWPGLPLNKINSKFLGGSKYAKIGIDDFQHLILDGIQGEQASDFTIIVTFNGLGLFPR